MLRFNSAALSAMNRFTKPSMHGLTAFSYLTQTIPRIALYIFHPRISHALSALSVVMKS